MTERSHHLRTWRHVAERPSAGDKSSRRLGVALLAASVLAVIGAFLAWLTYISPIPKAEFLPLCIGEYEEEFPVRGWVRQDGDALRELGWKQTNAFTSQQLALLRGELGKLAGRTFGGPLVVYVNAYALATPQGEPCLLPIDARLDRPDTWLPLREVFSKLHDAKAKHKLLVLDIMQPFIDARRGLLVNDSAERLQPLLDEVLAIDPHLSVLCACAPGQISIVAEELGHSVFAFFLWEGLRGKADGQNDSRRNDGRVSFQELTRYVKAKVEQWTLRHRGVRQSPRSYGAVDDYPLIAAGSSADPPAKSPLERDYPAWLSAGWKQRDHWLDEDSFGLARGTFQELERALLRAEQQWRGGFPIERVRPELAARRERLERQRRERLPAAGTTMPESLAQATAGGRNPPELPDAEAIESIAQLAARHARAAKGKPDAEELNKLKSQSDQLLKKFAGKPLALAWAVFKAADADMPTPASLRFLSDLLLPAQAPEYGETRLLARLAELPVAKPDDWPAEGAQLALRTIWEAEKAACGDPRAMPWVREARAAADRLRQQGEMLLFAADPLSRRRAAELLRGALKAYQKINHDLEAIKDAQRCCAEMLVQLPSYVRYLEVDAAAEKAWENAVATASELRRVLAEPLPPPGSARSVQIRKMRELTEALRNDPDNLNSLRRPLGREQFEKLIGRSEVGDFADAKVMTALLETPWPRAEQRAALWKARYGLLERLGLRRAPTHVPAWDQGQALQAERDRAKRRAHRSQELLKLKAVGLLASEPES